MAGLAPMPPITVDPADLVPFGAQWRLNGGALKRTQPYSSGELGKLFDNTIGKALAMMLGGIPLVLPSARSLTPPLPDCVEVGPVRIIGGVRPQNFDVGYRPDGVRFVSDSKTLNDTKSVGKNWQNMINDLATEATTVHSRFPYAIVAFIFIVPVPCFFGAQRKAIIETLERLARRSSVDSAPYLVEAISVVAWNPDDGTIASDVPGTASPLWIGRFSERIQWVYQLRYKGLPPHAVDEPLGEETL